jgi:ribonuclease PH
LRSIVDLEKLGERSITLDADVIQADGGTRTAAITGCWVALKEAVNYLLKKGKITQDPIKQRLAAVSVGLLDGQCMLDLDYSEDFRAEVDMNVVMTEDGRLVEVQGTAEGRPFSEQDLRQMLKLAKAGITKLIALQN